MKHINDEILNRYLDSALDSVTQTEAEAHLAACPECAARLASLHATFAALEGLPEVGLTHDLSAAVVETIKSKRLPLARPALTPAIRIAFVFQAVLALGVAVVAVPLTAQFLTTLRNVELPLTINSLVSNLQSLLTLPSPQALVPANLFALPTQLPISEFSTLVLIVGLVAVTALWFVGNGLLLRPNRRTARK